MSDRGHLGLTSYAKAVIGPAGRRHGFVTFNADLLQEILRQADDGLRELGLSHITSATAMRT